MSTSTNTLPTEDVPEDVEEGLFSRCVKILPLSPPRPLKPPQKPWPLTSDISSRICGGALEEEPRSIHPKRTWSFFQARERLTSGYVCHLVAILYPWLQLRRYLPRSGEVKKLTILKHTHWSKKFLFENRSVNIPALGLRLDWFEISVSRFLSDKKANGYKPDCSFILQQLQVILSNREGFLDLGDIHYS